MHADSTGLVTVSTLAQGGMGRVDLALRREAGFARAYAVKRLREEVVSDERLRTLFLREARVAGLVRHPNVVSVLDFGVDSAGPYLVMDFVPGMSLAHLMRAAGACGGLPMQSAVRIAKEMAAGLHAAHELRDEGRWLALVHRDVTPENVLIGLDGIARITDFGIAKSALASGETTGTLLRGKVGYLAPEQLRFTQTSRTTDLFALGVVLFEMVAGRVLYHEGDMETAARRILDEEPPRIEDARSDVPPALARLVLALLQKDPADRPADARQVERQLDSVLCDLVLHEGPRFVADFLERELHSEVAQARAMLAKAWREFGVVEVLAAQDTPRLAEVFEDPVGPLVLDTPVAARHAANEAPLGIPITAPVSAAALANPRDAIDAHSPATRRAPTVLLAAIALVALVGLGYAIGVSVSQAPNPSDVVLATESEPGPSSPSVVVDDVDPLATAGDERTDDGEEHVDGEGEVGGEGGSRPERSTRRRRGVRGRGAGSKLWEW